MKRFIIILCGCALTLSSLAATGAVAQVNEELDCELEENQNEAECLALPLETDETITNFVPIIGGIVGAAVVAGALAGGAESSGSTNNTN